MSGKGCDVTRRVLQRAFTWTSPTRNTGESISAGMWDSFAGGDPQYHCPEPRDTLSDKMQVLLRDAHLIRSTTESRRGPYFQTEQIKTQRIRKVN